MKYSKLQKFLSSLIIFSLLFGTTFRIPLLQFSTFANSKDFYNLVAILVNEEIYSSVEEKVKIYSKDIQGVLENTKVVILPTPKDTKAFNIASMLESLYFDGYAGLRQVDFESKLIGTILVGDFNLPEIYIGENSSNSIVPYTDFVDKKYIFNNTNNKYEENSNNIDGLKSEIWHGIISPNLGSDSENIIAINNYFDKNHDFYKGTGNFKFSDGILNGNNTLGVKSSYEPFVFYYDNFRENESLNYESYESYVSYLENKEDIVYDRYTKELAQKITNKLLGDQNNSVSTLINNVDSDFDTSALINAPDTQNTPDIQTRNIIEQATNMFLESFSEGTIGEFRADVHNAGRYNEEASKVNADFVPYLISVLDLVNDEIIKRGNYFLEDKIDEIVKTKLQENILVPETLEKANFSYVSTKTPSEHGSGSPYIKMENLLYGKRVKDIEKATDCSIFRGSTNNSGKLVESNRGYDFALVEDDVKTLKAESISCLEGIENKSSLTGYWGSNTPLNSDFASGTPELLTHITKDSITSLFDIAGSKDAKDNLAPYPNLPVKENGNSYRDCEENNFVVTSEEENYGGKLLYSIPIEGQSKKNWTCRSKTKHQVYNRTYEEIAAETRIWVSDNSGIPSPQTRQSKCSGLVCIDEPYRIIFKSIPSYTIHKSPTFEEIDTQMDNMLTPSLPVDRDRYIDFKSKATKQYQKINYPYLFRLTTDSNEELNVVNIKNELKDYLNDYDLDLNESLYTFLSNKNDTIGTKGNYLDNLTFALYWNNLGVSGKYKFVFENYLSDQFGGNDYEFGLSKNKAQYEMAYLGSKGDASNMYVLLDPNAKAENPYADIIAQNKVLKSSLLGMNINDDGANDETTFKCAPPEGVPLWQWFPAIMCRIGNMLPPTISVSTDACSSRTSLLSEEDKLELLNNGGDTDKNGIIDCIEAKLAGGSLKLQSDASKYYYGKIGKLKAQILDVNGNVATIDSLTNVKFDLIEVYIPENEKETISETNRKLIYNNNGIEGSDLNNTGALNEVKKYIDFTSGTVKAKYGMAEKSFVIKNKVADFVFKASYEIQNFNKEVEYEQSSEEVNIIARGDKLFANSYRVATDENGDRVVDLGLSGVLASATDNIFISNVNDSSSDLMINVDTKSNSKEKLLINLINLDESGNKIDLSFPISVEILKDGKSVLEVEKIYDSLESISSLGIYNKSGIYEFIIKDNFGSIFKKQIEILPEIASRIDIDNSASIIETGGNITQNVFSLYDEFDNVVAGEFYTIKASIDGSGLSFESDNEIQASSKEFTTYEGYSLFKLISTDNISSNRVNFSVKKFDDEKELFSDNVNIKTIDDIQVELTSSTSDIKVGYGEYTMNLVFKGSDGNILSDFNSRVYFNIPSIYGTSSKDYFDVINGQANILFNTKNVAGKDINVELQIEGVTGILQEKITINPEDPMNMDLYLGSQNIEASDTSYTNLRVELKDKYSNIVFTDKTTDLKFEIPDNYKNIINVDSNSTTFDEGIANFKIYATDLPGRAYYKLSTTPSLSNNSFEIKAGTGTLTLTGVGETAGHIETSYFWNKDKIDGKKYNALYTTLLGADYGNIKQENYLAGSILFDKENKALGVTSLLSNPYKTNDILNIAKEGNLKNIYLQSDLIQEIELFSSSIDNKLSLDIFNKSLNNYIGKVFYNFDDNTSLQTCDSGLETCQLNDNETTIFTQMSNSNYKMLELDGQIIITDNFDNKIFSISNNGTITKYKNVNFSINDDNTNNYLLFDIFINDEIIGNLGFNFVDASINISRDQNIFDSKITSLKNSILVLLNSNLYLSKNLLDNEVIYYNDPFDNDNKVNEFADSNMDGYENFINKKGLGWSEGNKTLLEFASGKSIGESVKDYMSFGVINLGDPVISLKKIKEKLPKTSVERKFDSTVGHLISNDSKVKSYEVFDYNNDDLDDILLIKSNGFFELKENKNISGNFLNKGNLLNVVDLGEPELVVTGDFTGDSYDDIFFVNNKGKPSLFNNNKKDFSRVDLEKQFGLKGKIIKVKVFNMDNDNIDDLVTFDDNGTINIFYGTGTSDNPSFTKKTITDEYGLNLGTGSRNDKALIYFDGLYQLGAIGDNSDLITNSENYLHNLENSNDLDQTGFSYDVIDNLMFERINYNTGTLDASGSLNNSIPEYTLEDFENIEPISETDLVNPDYNLISDDFENKTTEQITTFIKSEYAESAGIKVEKIFSDVNGGFLKSDDIIKVDITLTNTSDYLVENIAYGERLDDIFTLDESTITVSSEHKIDTSIPTLTFLLNSFALDIGETLIISYKAKTKQLDYGDIKVGLFEKDELDDDEFGDIIFGNNNQNCSKDVNIFRSISERVYEEGTKTPECDANKSKLPSSLEANSLDSGGNGIPDYIDVLSNPNDLDSLKDYSDIQLDNFNDSSPYYDDNKSVDNQIDSALEEADNIIDSISCGFGGASCIATPLNWAPLAPGGDPTLFGYPIGDGLNIGEGLPVFSALTWAPYGPICGPAVWPPSPLTVGCGGLGAGGMLGTMNPTNQFRLFITPTLTGGVGTAICFGGPPIIAGYEPYPGISPIVPGGNCIVMAKPLAQCSDDGSDGDIVSTGFSSVSSDSYEILNGNCKATNTEVNMSLESDLADDYYDYKQTGTKSISMDSELKGKYDEISKGKTTIGDAPLIQLGSGGVGSKIEVGINFSGFGEGDFSDIVQITKSRNFDFPQFLMEWVIRQVEEIANKLTDFPTVFIIFPDFSGIFDGDWSELSGNKDKTGENINVSNKITSTLDKSEVGKSINSGIKKGESGIKAAYDFLSNIPLVKFEKETVNINFPWIDQDSLNRTVEDRKKTVDRRKEELKEFTESVSFGATCDDGDEQCSEKNEIANKITIDAQALISSLEQNISILEEYKKLPEKIYNWLNVKERYLQQILCNIESISTIMGGRISKNGKRFKAWVNLYILIKAILKSWQLLIDVFTDYEAECHECKNERMDLMTFIWGLIDMIIPKIPVIQFPKWPDIILDLHNIRAGLTINLPEFNINSRPILLPYLPELKLPRVPNINFVLPKLPLLPSIEIPELPDLPSLPLIELPDLPPPPTLPNLLSPLEAILNILKLITKLMCILKRSPFVPEWRAGDQIAFLTERQGYLSLDFLFALSMPQFSFPFVDAIKVTTYVNLEFEIDFIVELARQAAMPINNFTNNVTNLLDMSIVDVDLSQGVPGDIEVDVGGEIGLNKNIDKKKLLALVLVKNFKKLFNYVNDHKNDRVTIEQFQKNINTSLASENFIKDPKSEKLRELWTGVNNYSYTKENKLINELSQNNTEKFKLIKDIINTEIIKNKNYIKDINDIIKPNKITKVGYTDNKVDIDFYNEKLSGYNDKIKNAALSMVNNQDNKKIKKELNDLSKDVVNQIKGGLTSYSKSQTNKLLSAVTGVTGVSSSETTCQAQANSDYKYNYEGLYVVENGTSYRLFDYIDELDGNEKTTIIDIDNDGDEDLLYMANGELFVKNNLETKDTKIYVTDEAIVLEKEDNKFLNGDIFYEAVNGFNAKVSENNFLNISFDHSNNQKINNYRIELFSIVDKFLNINNDSYIPKKLKKSVIDGFSSIDESTINKEETLDYIQRGNLGYINNIGLTKSLILKTYEFDNIKDDIINMNIVDLSEGTILYTGKDDVILEYTSDSENKNETNIKIIIIPKYSNIELKKSIEVSGINTDLYIKTNRFVDIEGPNISNYKGLPLLPGTQIINTQPNNNSEIPRYIEIVYYDGSKLDLDFSKVIDYQLYDLGIKSKSSYVRLNKENDFYYAKIQSFKNNIFSTLSNQIVVYPQIQADNKAPELKLKDSIKIPVYQKKIIDLSSDIFEDGGIENVGEIFIDFDLEKDSDNDGDTKNDRDTDNINILSIDGFIKIEFGEYDELFKKKIGIGLIDNNSNTSFNEVGFEVYSPIPSISEYSTGIINGKIDEVLENEPIDLYRYRGGLITKLTTLSGSGYVNTVSGTYEFEVPKENNKGLNLYDNNILIASINENTGLIDKKDYGSKIEVLASNDINNNSAYPKILVKKGTRELYYQTLKVLGNNPIEIIDNMGNLNESSNEGVYLQFLNKTSYNYYSIPEGVNYDAGTIVIYLNSDSINKKALFSIYKDGRVNVLNNNYKLSYYEENGFIGYKLIHENKEVAIVILKINGKFVID